LQIILIMVKKAQLNKTGKLKKAQLKIQEMAFMLMAVVLFFVLVGIFVVSIVYINLYDQANIIAEEKTLSALINLADSPEFNCVTTKSNCVDADKLISILDEESYKDFWTFSSLKVIRFKAFDKSEEEMAECTFANYPDCDIFVVYDNQVKNEKVISSYIALCRKEYENYNTYDKCEIARLVAGTEIINIGDAKDQGTPMENIQEESYEGTVLDESAKSVMQINCEDAKEKNKCNQLDFNYNEGYQQDCCNYYNLCCEENENNFDLEKFVCQQGENLNRCDEVELGKGIDAGLEDLIEGEDIESYNAERCCSKYGLCCGE